MKPVRALRESLGAGDFCVTGYGNGIRNTFGKSHNHPPNRFEPRGNSLKNTHEKNTSVSRTNVRVPGAEGRPVRCHTTCGNGPSPRKSDRQSFCVATLGHRPHASAMHERTGFHRPTPSHRSSMTRERSGAGQSLPRTDENYAVTSEKVMLIASTSSFVVQASIAFRSSHLRAYKLLP